MDENVYLLAYNQEGLNSGCQNKGTWTPATDTPPFRERKQRQHFPGEQHADAYAFADGGIRIHRDEERLSIRDGQ